MYAMKKDRVVNFRDPGEARDAFTALKREGAQRPFAQAAQSEFDTCFPGLGGQADGSGRQRQ